MSPLTPGSPTFPDGVMTPWWLSKHADYVPAAFVSFFNFTSDPSRNSLNDNQLKSEINTIKGAFAKSDYKTRFVVVLLSDRTVLQSPDIEERLGNIRRSTGLDPKNSLFFLPPNTSRIELSTFAHSVLTALQPACVEYYRDLTKHARRKKGRGSIPAPTAPPTKGTSQTLSGAGWNVRYDYKLGVFAEYRQEMDAAGRHYSFALDTLLSTDGMFETTHSWSARWDDARLLADSIAMRIMRCLLWNGQPTAAAQSWTNYRDRMRDIIDRRGKGSSNYGWQAWESRWAKAMAQTIEKSELPEFALVDGTQNPDRALERLNAIYAPAEKAIPVGERLPPWHLLHHAGYWFRLSAYHTVARRMLAHNLPDEDRAPPGQSPATNVARRNDTYDTYLVPEPHEEHPSHGTSGFDHTGEAVDLFNSAVADFHARGQQRMVDKLSLDIGIELLTAGRYTDAMSVLKPLWEGMSWRKERWWDLVSQVTWAYHDCATFCRDVEGIVTSEWELMSDTVSYEAKRAYDFTACLNFLQLGVEDQKAKPHITLNADSISSFLQVDFAFAGGEAHVGEPLGIQVVLNSRAHKQAAPITLSSIELRFKGCLDVIEIGHSSESSSTPSHTPQYLDVALKERTDVSKKSPKPSWTGNADLSIHPGQTKIFASTILFREAGELALETSTIKVAAPSFYFALTSTALSEEVAIPKWWSKSTRSGARAKRLNREIGLAIDVQPKPPKMEIKLLDHRAQYYTDEQVTLQIELVNDEDEQTESTLEARFLSTIDEQLRYSWIDEESGDPTSPNFDLPGRQVGLLSPRATKTQSISFKAPSEPLGFTLEIKVLYHLLSDPSTPVSKILSVEIVFVNPFEANYDFLPRVHPDTWPSYFSMSHEPDTDPDAAAVTKQATTGIAQAWQLVAKIVSFAAEDLIIHDTSLELHSVAGGATCAIHKPTGEGPLENGEPQLVAPHGEQQTPFDLTVTKQSLDDRRSSSLDLSLLITWSRPSTTTSSSTARAETVTSTLIIPRLQIPSSEPRVLCSATPSSIGVGGEQERSETKVIHLTYTIENPSMHYLSFEISMEASDSFAFSGPKLRTLNVLPISRQTVSYNVLPLLNGSSSHKAKGAKDAKESGVYINPQLKVVDRYFQKVLKVLGTEGCEMDRERGVLVWIPDGGEVDI